MSELRIKLILGPVWWYLVSLCATLNGQPVCSITGGNDEICNGTSMTWSAPAGMLSYLWTGPEGFSAITQDITISTAGSYIIMISDINGTSTCSRSLTVNPELSPGTINTTLRQFCAGGTAAIGGTSFPYGPATGGSGSYIYAWQLQTGCTGVWTDIPGTNTTSYTPAPPPVTTCYRRKVTDLICNDEAWTDFKRFEIFEDPVSQDIIPVPGDMRVCSNSFISATFTGGSGGFPGGTIDIYEYSTDSGSSWNSYFPGQTIPASGLSGPGVLRIRTRRVSSGVNGCNWGLYITVSWRVNPAPITSPIYHR